jgi:DNA invertase Pin-like site-specific DNA recombinase
VLVGYARISTQLQNLDLQVIALEKAGCEKIFIEKASGSQRERPELKLALDYMTPSKDALVVWKLDSLARSFKQLLETIENFKQQNIGLLSLTEFIDTTTSDGRLIFHIFASLAEFERSVIRERTIVGLKAAKQKGRIGGRPSALKLTDIIAAKILLRNPNITVEAVAQKMKISAATLYRHIPGGRGSVIN